MAKKPKTDDETPRIFEPVDVCARRFALGWRAVVGAASDDDTREAIYRSVLIEQHDSGLRLVATNSYLLLWTWIGYDETAHLAAVPDIDEAPLAEVVVRDLSGLPAALFAHIIKSTTSKEGPDRISELELSVGRIESRPDRPTLSEELDQPALVARCWREAVAIPIVEAPPYPAWRSAIDSSPVRGLKRIGLSSEYLKVVASVRIDDRGAVWAEMIGSDRGLNLTIPGDPVVHGRLMPVRDEQATGEIEAAS